MKTIGLLGGMSWESTITYYRLINEGIKTLCGGLHSAKICLYSVDFDEIEKMQHTGNWAGTAEKLSSAARRIEAGGADFLLICTNTMHKVCPRIESSIRIPVLHIADATAAKMVSAGVKTAGLLGTEFTMTQDFYKGRLEEKYGIKVIVPGKEDRTTVHHVIYNELCLGKISNSSRERYITIIDRLSQKGAEGVILGCTEIPLLIQQEHTVVPLFDTTQLHAEAAVEWALS